MAMSKEAREAKSAYQRAWIAKNPDKHAEYVKKYREENRAKIKEWQVGYWERLVEKRMAKQREGEE